MFSDTVHLESKYNLKVVPIHIYSYTLYIGCILNLITAELGVERGIRIIDITI